MQVHIDMKQKPRKGKKMVIYKLMTKIYLCIYLEIKTIGMNVM